MKFGQRVTLTDGSTGVIMGSKPGAYLVKLPTGERWVKPEDIKEYNEK